MGKCYRNIKPQNVIMYGKVAEMGFVKHSLE